MKRIFAGILTVLMVMSLTVPGLAGTRDDCITKCKEAGDFIKTKGIDAAVKEIGNRIGADEGTTGKAIGAAVPLLLSALSRNASKEMTSLTQKLSDHEMNAVLDYSSRLLPSEELRAPAGWKNPDFD